MRKILNILIITLLSFSMLFGISSCGKVDNEATMEKYITDVSASIEVGYKDFDITIKYTDSNDKVYYEYGYIIYNSESAAYIYEDDKETTGMEYQKVIRYTDVEYTARDIRRGDENIAVLSVDTEGYKQMIQDIYDNYFTAFLPKSIDDIIESKKIVDIGGMSNLQIMYKITIDEVEKEALIKLNTLTDRIHYLAIVGEVDGKKTTISIEYNYPKLGGNVFSKKIPTLDEVIENAKAPADSTSEN